MNYLKRNDTADKFIRGVISFRQGSLAFIDPTRQLQYANTMMDKLAKLLISDGYQPDYSSFTYDVGPSSSGAVSIMYGRIRCKYEP